MPGDLASQAFLRAQPGDAALLPSAACSPARAPNRPATGRADHERGPGWLSRFSRHGPGSSALLPHGPGPLSPLRLSACPARPWG